MSFSTMCVPGYTNASDASGGLNLMVRRWATKKSGGSAKIGKDSNPKYLGVKKLGGEETSLSGSENYTRKHPGAYDHALFALKEGNVRFEIHKLSGRKFVHVDSKDGHVVPPIYANLPTDHPIYENLAKNCPTYAKRASKPETKEDS